MDKEALKRKSIAYSNTTPNKIQKIDSPVSQTIKNQSPISVAEHNEVQINVNKLKSSNENQMTTRKDEENEKIEINDSNNDEVDLGEEVQAGEDEEADSDEDKEADSKDAEVNADDDANETQNMDKVKIKREFSVFVKGLTAGFAMDRIFPGCNIQSVKEVEDSQNKRDSKNAYVVFNDQESMKKAVAKRQINIDGNIIKVELTGKILEFAICVKGIYQEAEVQDLFNDCEIICFQIMTIKGEPSGSAFIYFEDELSLKKALSLAKKKVKTSGSNITVNQYVPHNTEFIVFVRDVYTDSEVQDLFNDCQIRSINFMKNLKTGGISGIAFVQFEDEESMQEALLKNKTKFNGRKMEVKKDISRNFSVFVNGLNPNLDVKDIFQDCNIKSVRLSKESKHAIVFFANPMSLLIALEKNGTEFNGSIIKVRATKETEKQGQRFVLFVDGLSPDGKIQEIFGDCKILCYHYLIDETTRELNGKAYVVCHDERSVQKALLKDNTEQNGSVIKVCRNVLSIEGLQTNKKSELSTIFSGCKFGEFYLQMNPKTCTWQGNVYFKDVSSLEKAFAMNTPSGITVTLFNKKFSDYQDQTLQKRGNKAKTFAKRLLLRQLKSQVQKVTEEMSGTSKVRPKFFHKRSKKRKPRT